MPRLIFVVGLMMLSLISPPQLYGSESLTGHWSGIAKTSSEKTKVIIAWQQDSATLSLPDVGVLNWPAASSSVEGNRIQLSFQSDSGQQKMTLFLANNTLQGEWSDPRLDEQATITLTKTNSSPVLPEQCVLIPSAVGNIGASIILPNGQGPFPGVVFLHGSGPQPRDANRFQAQALAQRGIASIIYDKRGVGESTGETYLTAFADLATDAITVAEFLKKQTGISHVGFYGHSQGGWVAPLAASRWPDTAFVITSSGPLVSPARESQWDVVRAMRKAGANETQVDQARNVIELWYASLKNGQSESFAQAMKKISGEPWFESSGLREFADPIDGDTAKRILLNHEYDPLPALRSLKAPLLWILSDDDESIDAIETVHLLEKEQSTSRPIQIKRYKGFDHSLRRLGPDGQVLRWPSLPSDLFDVQSKFVEQSRAKDKF